MPKFVIEYTDTIIIEADNEDEAWSQFDEINQTYTSADLVYTYEN